MIKRIRKNIYHLMESPGEESIFCKAFEVFMLFFILLNVLATILETVPSLIAEYSLLFARFQFFSFILFTMEYLLRIWVCVEEERYAHPIKGRLKFVKSPLAIIDLAVILPFFVPFFLVDLRVLRLLRLFRLLSIFKLVHYFNTFNRFVNVLIEKKTDFIVSFVLVFVLLIFSSSGMYYFEHNAQPEKFKSIPDAMWWGVATLTTVGYGDMYPITVMGKVFGALIAMLGIGMFAVPAGIFASGLLGSLQSNEQQKEKCCPHCGKAINKID